MSNLNIENSNESPRVIAQRLLNLFNQMHVIKGGIQSLNEEFVKIPTQIITEIKNIPGGRKLALHIGKLQRKETPLDKIAPDLLPFGITMLKDGINVNTDILQDKPSFLTNTIKIEDDK